MNCGLDKEKLDAFFDGELDAAERRAVEEHISTCSECLRDLGEIRAAAQQVHGLARLRAPASLAESVSRAVAAEARSSAGRRFGTGLFWATAAAAAVLVVMNVVYFTDLKKETPSLEDVAMAPAASGEGEYRRNVPARADLDYGRQEEVPDREEPSLKNEVAKDMPAFALESSGKSGYADEKLAKAGRDSILAARALEKDAESDDLRAKAAAPPSPAGPASEMDEAASMVKERGRAADGWLAAGDKRDEAPAAPAAVPMEAGKSDVSSRSVKGKEEGGRAEAVLPEEEKPALPEYPVYVADVGRARTQVEAFMVRKGQKGFEEEKKKVAARDARMELDLTDDELAELLQELHPPVAVATGVLRKELAQKVEQSRRRIVLVLHPMPPVRAAQVDAADASREPAAK